MRVELSRVRVKPGKSGRVDEWLAMLNDRMAEVKDTLVREEMKVEAIFREIIDGDEYLYWFSVQGDAGADVNDSPHPLDHDHMAFHKECIDHSYGAHDAQVQVVMVPDSIADCLAWPDPAADVAPFEAREIVYRPPPGYDDSA